MPHDDRPLTDREVRQLRQSLAEHEATLDFLRRLVRFIEAMPLKQRTKELDSIRREAENLVMHCDNLRKTLE